MPLVFNSEFVVGHGNNLLKLIPHTPVEQYRAAVQIHQDELGLGVLVLEAGVQEVVQDGVEVEFVVGRVDADRYNKRDWGLKDYVAHFLLVGVQDLRVRVPERRNQADECQGGEGGQAGRRADEDHCLLAENRSENNQELIVADISKDIPRGEPSHHILDFLEQRYGGHIIPSDLDPICVDDLLC